MVKLIQAAADRALERLVPHTTASAARRFVYCHCRNARKWYKECSVTGSWCTECIYQGDYCV